MITENKHELNEILKKLQKFRDFIYDFDYDENALWHLDEAINNLKRI